MSEVKCGVLLNYISIGVRMGTTFLLTPYVMRSLGVTEYGLYMLSGSVIAWLALSDLGLGATVGKYVITYQSRGEYEQQAHFLGQSIILYCFIAIIASIAGVICFYNLDVIFPKLDCNELEILQILFLLTLGNLIVSIPMRPLTCVPSAYQKFVLPGIVSLSCSLLNSLLTVVLLILGFKSIALTVLSVIMGVGNLLWIIFYTIKVLGVSVLFNKPDTALYRSMFRFSIWIFMNQIMELIYWQVGSPITANVVGAHAVPIFTLGTSLAFYFMTASTAISGVLAPKLMHMVVLQYSTNDLTNVMIRAGRLQYFLLIIIFLGFVFLGYDFLSLWVGDTLGSQVKDVWFGALLVIFALIIPLTQNTGIAILQALSIHHGRAIILFTTALMCLMLGFALSIFYGVMGMFIATAISLIMGQNILMNLYYKYKAGLYVGRFFRETYFSAFKALLISIVSGVIISKHLNVETWIDFILFVCIYGILFFVIHFFLYLSAEDRASVLLQVMKICRRIF